MSAINIMNKYHDYPTQLHNEIRIQYAVYGIMVAAHIHKHQPRMHVYRIL